MSLILPPSGSPLRELFDVADLMLIAEKIAAGCSPMSLASAINSARSVIGGSIGVLSINYIVVDSEENLLLVNVGDGFEILWNFGSAAQFKKGA